MKRTHYRNRSIQFLSALFFLFLSKQTFAMHEHKNHVLIEALHNTLYTVVSDTQFKVTSYWLFLDTYQALLILRHDVASNNTNPHARSFCTCVYYRMLDTEYPQQLDIYSTVPDYHKNMVQEYIASNGLPDLQFSVSSYLKKN